MMFLIIKIKLIIWKKKVYYNLSLYLKKIIVRRQRVLTIKFSYQKIKIMKMKLKNKKQNFKKNVNKISTSVFLKLIAWF